MGMLSSQKPESLKLISCLGVVITCQKVCDDSLREDTDRAPSSRVTMEPDTLAESAICPLAAEKCVEKLVETLRTRR